MKKNQKPTFGLANHTNIIHLKKNISCNNKFEAGAPKST